MAKVFEPRAMTATCVDGHVARGEQQRQDGLLQVVSLQDQTAAAGRGRRGKSGGGHRLPDDGRCRVLRRQRRHVVLRGGRGRLLLVRDDRGRLRRPTRRGGRHVRPVVLLLLLMVQLVLRLVTQLLLLTVPDDAGRGHRRQGVRVGSSSAAAAAAAALVMQGARRGLPVAAVHPVVMSRPPTRRVRPLVRAVR